MKRSVALTLGGVLLLTAACSSRSSDQVALREPDNASRLRIAETAAAAGQIDIALSMYTAAAAAAPNDPDVQTRLASILIRAGRPDDAEQILNRALVNRPGDPSLLHWSGNVRLETGYPEAALQIFDQLLARKSTDIASLNGRGVALDMLNRHDAAQQTYRTAQSLAPGNLQTANNLAVSYLLDHRPAAARDVLQPFLRQPNLPQRVSNNYAIAQAALGAPLSADQAITGPLADDLQTLAASLNAGSPTRPAPDLLPTNRLSGTPSG